MKRHTVATILILLVSAVVVADDISLGYYGETGFYSGAYMNATVEQYNLYVEHAGGWDYTLAMLDAAIGDNGRIGIRFESPNIFRPYIKESQTIGDGWVTARWTIGGLGVAKHRFDLFAGCPINNHVAVEGWGRFQSSWYSDYWIGPKVSYDRFSLWYGFNLRGAGDDTIIANCQVATW